MKWVDDGGGVYCPTCAKTFHKHGPEPDFDKPGCDHCSTCGSEYFNSPPGILKRFEQHNAVTGVEMDDIRTNAVRLLRDWYELHPGYTAEFMETLDKILES